MKKVSAYQGNNGVLYTFANDCAAADAAIALRELANGNENIDITWLLSNAVAINRILEERIRHLPIEDVCSPSA